MILMLCAEPRKAPPPSQIKPRSTISRYSSRRRGSTLLVSLRHIAHLERALDLRRSDSLIASFNSNCVSDSAVDRGDLVAECSQRAVRRPQGRPLVDVTVAGGDRLGVRPPPAHRI